MRKLGISRFFIEGKQTVHLHRIGERPSHQQTLILEFLDVAISAIAGLVEGEVSDRVEGRSSGRQLRVEGRSESCEVLDDLRSVLLFLEDEAATEIEGGAGLSQVEGEELLSLLFNEVAFTQAHLYYNYQRPPLPL